MELYNTLKLLIERGRTDGLTERIDVLYALGRLESEQYQELMGLLSPSGE